MTSRAWARALPLLLPLVLVNTAAVYGQAGWSYDHLIRNWLVALLFAAAIESIGVYLAFEAHAALMAGDASARLRLGSYLVGLLAGALNYAHFADAGYRPTPLAVTFAALSSISPWLWAIRSRSMNRARLRELGQIDPRAVRFAALRWALFPVRTFRAFRVAVWHGIVTPAAAVARSGVKAPGLPAGEVVYPVADPEPVEPGEALWLSDLASAGEHTSVPALPVPVSPAGPVSTAITYPLLRPAPRMAGPVSNAPTSAPPADSRRPTATVAERVAELTSALGGPDRLPPAKQVATILGHPNISTVAKELRKARQLAAIGSGEDTSEDKEDVPA